MSTPPTWADLRLEYDSDVIGPLWLAEVTGAVHRVAERYPPAVYSETGHWNTEALENLVQDVVVSQLLDEGQIDYIAAVATSVDSARGLLTRTVKRTLARGRRRTVIDNLLDRAHDITAFVPPDHPGPQATNEAILACANQIAKLPRVRIINSDRAPIVYTTEHLTQALAIAANTAGPALRRREMEKILQLVLSDYVPSALIQFEGGSDEPDRSFTPDDELIIRETMNLLTDQPAETLTILALKIANRSDTDVAHRLGISRPTAAKKFKQASADVGSTIRELAPHVQDEVLARFADRLLADHLPHTEPLEKPDDR
ncbi:hypothetical protein [Nocardioides sp. MH1]|uniref:hypothetical protein n=1 Tax=Nocardioides sp. MH1 TaxID=3242490 RepID=UPI0035212BA5